MIFSNHKLATGELVEVNTWLTGSSLLKQVNGSSWHTAEVLDIRRDVLGGSCMHSWEQGQQWYSRVNVVPPRDEVLLLVFEDGTQSWFDTDNVRRLKG